MSTPLHKKKRVVVRKVNVIWDKKSYTLPIKSNDDAQDIESRLLEKIPNLPSQPTALALLNLKPHSHVKHKDTQFEPLISNNENAHENTNQMIEVYAISNNLINEIETRHTYALIVSSKCVLLQLLECIRLMFFTFGSPKQS